MKNTNKRNFEQQKEECLRKNTVKRKQEQEEFKKELKRALTVAFIILWLAVACYIGTTLGHMSAAKMFEDMEKERTNPYYYSAMQD